MMMTQSSKVDGILDGHRTKLMKDLREKLAGSVMTIMVVSEDAVLPSL
jgi:hypothetical protein